MKRVRRNDLVCPDLSYQIVGCAFEAHNSLGGGHHEQYYQRALAVAFRERGLRFIEQVYYPLQYHGTSVGKAFLDFVVEDAVVVEIKKGDRYSKRHIDQVMEYLKRSGKKLGILINFGKEDVRFKRVINFS